MALDPESTLVPALSAADAQGDASKTPPKQDDATKPKKKTVKTTKVVNGIESEVEIEVDDLPAPAWPARADLKILNHDLLRVDGPAKVTGRAQYTHDVRLPGMLYARLLLSPVPKAAITVDVEPAKKIPGVEGVVVLQGKTITFLGQPIAAVAARTPEIAEDGLRAIVLTVEPQPWAVDHAQATKADAPKVVKEGNVRKPDERGKKDEAEAAFAGAAATVEAEYSAPVQHHASLETHGTVVDYTGGEEATVYCSTQDTTHIPDQASDPLGIKASRITGVVEYMGGGFGSKFEYGAEGRAACLLAKELKRPIHLMLTRRDEFLMAGNRSGARCRMKAGATADGTLVALISSSFKYGGISRGSQAMQPYIYRVEKPFAEVSSVHTNMDGNRAMRAPGHPQASFPMESILDELAYKVGVDLVEIRKKNLADETYHRQLERVAREIGWYEHANRSKAGSPDDKECIGIGFGCATWGGGGRPGNEVEVRIHRDGSVTAQVGSQDLGTGVRTYVAAITAEALGLPLAAVTPRVGNTKYGPGTGSGGSSTTGSLAPAVLDAALKARALFAEQLAAVLGCEPARARFGDGKVFDSGNASKAVSWKQACAQLPIDGLRAKGAWVESLQARGIHGVQAVKVRVDPLTGRITILDMVAMQDCGLPLNRLATVSQTNGGMIQGLSYGLLEERVVDPALGVALTANLEDYKCVHSHEIPRMKVILDDEDTRPPIGMAEAAIIPGHSALANAVANACGARVRDLPLTPDKVLAALGRA